MKKLFCFLTVLIFGFGAVQAQITYETTYPLGAIGAKSLGVIQLSSSGYKYMEADTDQIVIFNLNHSVYKTINIPQQTNVYYATWRVTYVSEELFNTNPNDVEYVLTYSDWNGNASHIRIYDENNNLLFTKDSVTLSLILGPGVETSGIAYTSNGVKMILSNPNTEDASVYSLPGSLPCTECSSGTMTGIAQQQNNNGNPQQYIPDPYPNPTNSTTTISYQLPDDVKNGEIVFYNMLGQEVKRFAVTNAFTTLLISAEDLAPGSYSYNLVTTEGIISGKKIMVTQ